MGKQISVTNSSVLVLSGVLGYIITRCAQIFCLSTKLLLPYGNKGCNNLGRLHLAGNSVTYSLAKSSDVFPHQ